MSPGRCHCFLMAAPRGRQAGCSRFPPQPGCSPPTLPSNKDCRLHLHRKPESAIFPHPRASAWTTERLPPLRLFTLPPQWSQGSSDTGAEQACPPQFRGLPGLSPHSGQKPKSSPGPTRPCKTCPAPSSPSFLSSLSSCHALLFHVPKLTRPGPASGPLHWLLPQPGTLSLQHSHGQRAMPGQTFSSLSPDPQYEAALLCPTPSC